MANRQNGTEKNCCYEHCTQYARRVLLKFIYIYILYCDLSIDIKAYDYVDKQVCKI